MEIILFIVIVSLLFPGSGRHGGFELMMIPVVIICIALIIGFVMGTQWIAIMLTIWLSLDPMWFMLFWPATILLCLFANKFICECIDRRKLKTS